MKPGIPASAKYPIATAAAKSAAQALAIVAAGIGLLSWNLFTFRILRLVPLGSAACGLLVANGVGRACSRARRLPDAGALGVAIAAGATVGVLGWALQYWLWRRALPADFLIARGFPDYLRARAAGAGAGAFPALRLYLAPMLDFAALALAAAWRLRRFRRSAACDACGRALARVGRVTHHFADSRDFHAWHRELTISAPLEEEYLTMLTAECLVESSEAGIHRYEFQLYRCTGCWQERVREIGAASDGRRWRALPELAREVRVPPKRSLVNLFRRLRGRVVA
jgi:hypothetical protein